MTKEGAQNRFIAVREEGECWSVADARTGLEVLVRGVPLVLLPENKAKAIALCLNASQVVNFNLH